MPIKICDNGHTKIIYDDLVGECPLCKAELELGKKEHEITQLEGTIESLNIEIAGYQQ